MSSKGRDSVISYSPLRRSQYEKYAGDKNTKQRQGERPREKDKRDINEYTNK
jgi:hypothetical protein